MSKVLYLRDGRIARITLNRPEVLNAIDAGMRIWRPVAGPAGFLGAITRFSRQGPAFKARPEAVGMKQAVRERDQGTYDWTENRPINAPR